MQKVIATLLLYFSIIASSAQSESVKPTFGVELDREVAYAIIEGKIHTDVILELKAASLGDLFSSGVKIIVKDAKTGKKIYKKRFANSYLYAFSNGTIQVGKGNALAQLTLYKYEEYGGIWMMEIRQK